MTEIEFSFQDLSFFKNHDFSGISGYTDEEKTKILNDFLNKCAERVFLSRSQRNLRLTEKPKDAQDIKVEKQEAKLMLKRNLKNAIIYLGYTEGNFKWAKHILCDEVKKGEEKYSVYVSIPEEENLGRVIASVSADIIECADRNVSWESNLSKMMKRQGYKLKSGSKRKYLFGKGHISAPREHKVQIKKDLNVLFEIMQRSKDMAQEGKYVIDISDKVADLTFFDFQK